MPHATLRQAVSIARASLRSRPGRLPSLPRRFLSSPPQNSRDDKPENHSSGNNHHHDNGNRPRQTANIKFLPFIAIIAVGSAAYVALVNRRKAIAMPPAADSQQDLPPPSSTPTFSPEKATVVFVLGGPGAGKGTQCARLVDQYAFTHLSAGDLLRAEQDRAGSQFGDLIRSHIKDGLIVPMEVTVQLLENAMTEAMARPGPRPARFLIDGFPRKLDQAYRFEGSVCEPSLVLFYDCPENVLRDRLLERGKTSGRADDNAESILKRFRTFVETSMPVVDHYDKRGAVIKIDATRDKDAVFADTQKRLKEKLGDDF
ncbi:Uridylate kinase [Ophiocordyceps camponoti-floridani]|uniref:Uridylate kinase n=1 Tax=Ophiocordyceps camponoti-floridani TaxID=2030778 RepID=A0A8H4Q0R7_9HYPO|nr:Uridylate kinase [Ophiocordyceps camponoti-floridani]